MPHSILASWYPKNKHEHRDAELRVTNEGCRVQSLWNCIVSFCSMHFAGGQLSSSDDDDDDESEGGMKSASKSLFGQSGE